MYNPNNPIKMIYKLSYTDKATAVADLTAKGILVESTFQEETSLVYGEGVAAVVEIGLIMIEPPVMDGMDIVTPPVYADGYHYDVMADNEYDFGANLVEPKNPKHAFAGHEITEEVQPILPTEEL
jgi:hypothetical protein